MLSAKYGITSLKFPQPLSEVHKVQRMKQS